MIRPWFSRTVVLALLVGLPSACSDDGGDDGNGGFSAGIMVNLASLNLAGIGDAIWDLEVVNGAGEVVWQQRLSSARYGDAQGGASFVGPCDPTAGVAENTVKVWVVGAYSALVTRAGKFASGATTGDGAVEGPALSFDNPTATGPLTRSFTCLDNQDVAVQFDIALAPAPEE